MSLMNDPSALTQLAGKCSHNPSWKHYLTTSVLSVEEKPASNRLPTEILQQFYDDLEPMGRLYVGLACRHFHAIFKARKEPRVCLLDPVYSAGGCEYESLRLYHLLKDWSIFREGYRFCGAHSPSRFLKSTFTARNQEVLQRRIYTSDMTLIILLTTCLD